MKDKIRSPDDLRVHFHNGSLEAIYKDETIPLPDELRTWLESVMTGHEVKKQLFLIHLPDHWLRKKSSGNGKTKDKRSGRKNTAAA